MITAERWVPAGLFARETGVDPGERGTIDAVGAAQRLGLPIVAGGGWWSIGRPAGPVHPDARCPDLELEDLDGSRVALADLRDRKVVLVAWAPY